MTPTERLVLENQITIMTAMARVDDYDKKAMLYGQVHKTRNEMAKSDTDGGR